MRDGERGTGFDREVDLLVVGGGAGGMTAALVAACEGLDVLLIEKTAQVGGTTATSGGTLWVPGNTQSRKTRRPDSVADARTYLDHELGDYGDPALREAFFESGAPALDYLEARTEVRFKANDPYPDYHAEEPGGAQGGRALASIAFDGKKLGADFDLLRPPMPEFMIFGGMMVGRDEIQRLIRPWQSWDAFRLACKLVWDYAQDRLRHPRGTRLLLGQALCGRLLYSLRQKGVDIAVDAPLVDLVKHDGRVRGAIVAIRGKHQAIGVRRGVVLAAGGCAGSARWREDLMGHPVPHALAFEGDSGDGLDAGIAAGGVVDRRHASPFFWMPASTIRWDDGREATYPHIRDRPKPGLIAVDSAGRRFVNEANSYHDFVSAMHHKAALKRGDPAWLICDRAFIRDYGIGVIHPVWQRLGYFTGKGYLVSAPTLAELAGKIGVNAAGLAQSVAEHNAAARTGVDPAFGKGSRALNRFNGDAAIAPNPCLKPIETAPYFALPVHPAPIGSSAGLATDADGRVTDAAGRPIGGLYACGNDMNSVMAGFYPGPGITLGPAIVFAWRVAMHAAGKAVGAGAPAAGGRISKDHAVSTEKTA